MIYTCFLQFQLTGAVYSLDGSKCIEKTLCCDIPVVEKKTDSYVITESQVVINGAYQQAVQRAEELGTELAVCLKEQGACEILREARELIAVTQDDLRMPKSS